MDDLLRELRAVDAGLAALSDEQLLRFLRCLIEAVDHTPLDDRMAMAAHAVGYLVTD